MGQSYRTTKGDTDRTENKKEQPNLETPLNYAQRKNQQQSSHSSASVGNRTEDAKLFSTTSSSPNLQSILASHQNEAAERGEQMLPDAMKQERLDSSQSGEQIAAETGVRSQVSTLSPRSLLPTRYLYGLMPLKIFHHCMNLLLEEL